MSLGEARVGWNSQQHALAITGLPSWDQVGEGFATLSRERGIVFDKEQILREMGVIGETAQLLERLIQGGGFMTEGVVKEGDMSGTAVPNHIKEGMARWMITHSEAKPLFPFLRGQQIELPSRAHVFFFHPHEGQVISYSTTKGGSINSFLLVRPDGNMHDLGITSSALVGAVGKDIHRRYKNRGLNNPYIPSKTAATIVLTGLCKSPQKRI